MAATDNTVEGTAHGASVFRRVLVGVDGTEPGFEACRQAIRLANADAAIEAVAVVHLRDALHAGFEAARFMDELQQEAEANLVKAVEILGPQSSTRFLNGFITGALLRESERFDATLIALGSHGHRRVTEILIGGVAGEVLHDAPCSVLVARPASVGFPRSIVVGVDGSDAAESALAAAEHLAARFHVPLTVLTAFQGKDVDLARIRRRSPEVESVDGHPVETLVSASTYADLVVVGSRGLHGMRALGSVSERVAHQAKSSVLVVRAP